MGAPLAAIADDGDGAALQEIGVGVLVAPASAIVSPVAPGPSVPYSLPIPNLPTFRGLTGTAQSLHLEATGNLATSRGLSLTVQ